MQKIYYSTAEVAEMTGKTTDGARKWLMRHGAARKIGGRWMTTRERINATFPEAFQAFAR